MPVRIKTPEEAYIVEYQQAIDATLQQKKVLWFAEELGVEKDVSDIRNNLWTSEVNGITFGLKLFTNYELKLGEEFWGTRVAKMFPRPADIQRMANMFAFTELNSHAPFYNAINEALLLNTREFYNSWKLDPILVKRMAFINKFLSHKNDLLALAAFTFMEGVVLFSNFGYFKSYNVNGFNHIPHITAGIDASAKDENFHSMASAWLFRQLLQELIEANEISEKEISFIKKMIYNIAKIVYMHEIKIAETLFSFGPQRNITFDQLAYFIRDRINVVLGYLNCMPMFNQDLGEISEWFYKQLSSFKYSDFFANTQIQYVRDWKRHELGFNYDLVSEFDLSYLGKEFVV